MNFSDVNIARSVTETASSAELQQSSHRSIRVLHIEDSQDDCDLVWRTLRREWKEATFVRVETRENLIMALRNDAFDLILADYQLPRFSGLEALEIVRNLKPDLPFIFLSGMMGEETAIDSLLLGATDYVLKDRASRLVPAIRRALKEAEERALNRELQERLVEADRLKAVGTLSTGISHDFNNILTIILSHAILLKTEVKNPDRIFQISNIVSAAARRAADIVHQLNAFAQKDEGHPGNTDLNQCIRQVFEEWQALVPSGIEFKFDAATGLPNVLMDEAQFGNILGVLIANSIDSMPGSGRIKLSTQVIHRDAIQHVLNTPIYERYVCVKCVDTGSGMSADIREHIFEPFYTTKERRHSTGMGLPMVYGLMQANNGWITVESELGQGTTISLFFPVQQRSVKQTETGTMPSVISSSKKRKLLVIEDEEDVRVILEGVLKSAGYEVLLASDGNEALTLFNKPGAEVELVISDIGLPGADGIDVCQQLRKLNPELKIMLSSGYPQKDFKTRVETLGIDGFLAKPYEPRELISSVRCVLEGEAHIRA